MATEPLTSSLRPPGTRRQIFAWTLFDFANTAFYVLILTVSYPLYFKEIVVGNQVHGDFLWGSTFSISMAITAMISPLLGAAADGGAGKKRFLFLFTILCIGATALLFFVEEGMIAVGMLLIILANIGFEAGLVFYDAFLPELTTPQTYGKVSGSGFAMGYVGSLVTLFAAYPLLEGGFIESNLMNVRSTFLLAAAFFLVFASPLFLFVRDQQQKVQMDLAVVRRGFHRVITTFRDLSKYRNVGRFLLAYFLYADAISTLIIFSSLFAHETLKMEITEIVLFFAIVQTSAIFGSIIFGFLSDRFGHKRTLNITLLLWLIIVLIAYFVTEKSLFYGIGLLAGMALGSSQSTSRSLMSLILPVEKKTEFFGFYSFFSKSSAIFGPLLFGALSSFVSQRAGILSIGAFFLLGLLALTRVKEEPYQSEPLASSFQT